MSTKDIWMPLFIGDYLKHTMRLSTAEHGAYLLLIMDYWIAGHLDDDDVQLSGITRLSVKEWMKIKPKITQFFILIEGRWRHSRIEEELQKSHKRIITNKLRAAKGGAATKAKYSGF